MSVFHCSHCRGDFLLPLAGLNCKDRALGVTFCPKWSDLPVDILARHMRYDRRKMNAALDEEKPLYLTILRDPIQQFPSFWREFKMEKTLNQSLTSFISQ